MSQLVADRFELIHPLASTLLSDVFLCRDPRLDRQVTVKMPRCQVNNLDDFTLQRQMQEARLVAQVDHANVVKVYDTGIAADRVYIVFEYVEGQDLRRWMDQRRGQLGLTEALQVTRQLCDGLGAIHAKGILHGDIKPENVLVTPDGQAKISDFNTATLIRATLPPGQLMGTYLYMAPEQFSAGYGKRDARTDIWAVGVLFYELLTGKYPFNGSGEMSAFEWCQAVLEQQPDWQKLPTETRPILRRALAKPKKQRFASAQALKGRLDALQAERQDHQVIRGRQLRDEGDQLQKDGKLQQALEKYGAALLCHPSAGLYFEIGYTYELCRNEGEATANYQKALELNRGYEHAERAIRRLRSQTQPFTDKSMECRYCGAGFMWAAGEQQFYSQRGFPPPARCETCRQRKKDTPAAGAGKATGKVKFFDTKRGFGFLIREGLPDVYVHISGITDGLPLHTGEQVAFRLVEVGGKAQARDVERL